MDNQKNAASRLTLPLSHVLCESRPSDTLIAWRDTQPLLLSDFRHRVSTLVAKLRSSPQPRWALCFDDSYLFSVALLALLYSGKTPVIPGHCRQSLLQQQRLNNAFDGLLTDRELRLDCPTLALSVERLNLRDPAEKLPDWPDNAEIILFTSGSTGQPKPVYKPVSLLEAESELLAQNWGERLSGTRIAATVSHQHLYGLTFRILLPLALGLPFHAQITEYHEQLGPLTKNSLTLIASPAYLKRLDPNLAPLNCAMVISAGGPLNLDEACRVKQLLKVLPVEIYGTSETGVIAWRQQETPKQPWSPFHGVCVAQQADGTIAVTSPLFNGDVGHGIHDEISLDPKGFHLLGRKDRIIKIEEKRLSLTEVELRLMALDEISDAAVIPVTQGDRTILAAAIVLTESGERIRLKSDTYLTQYLRQSLRQWLEPVALPKRWRILSSIPINPQSKRAYGELQELFL
ncbi:AMP-binding protein [Budvicia diplopodorum]|uniref:AMP-binding protein n=1 Tax=Budvicia diplopodorum TaxID=1119056 RepID=UPI00135CC401|nr:AMP-binding protein [Budvicia diplopodorum]